jgi:hypothetical protein
MTRRRDCEMGGKGLSIVVHSSLSISGSLVVCHVKKMLSCQFLLRKCHFSHFASSRQGVTQC